MGPLGRETFLFPVNWTTDGWPVFNNGEPIGLNVSILRNVSNPNSVTSWFDDFTAPKLDLSYYVSKW